MLRSLNSGVSGLKAFQTKLDVIGNNIANVNTTGFKKGTVVFEEVVSQTIKDATTPTTSQGGISPLQIGLGTRVANIQSVFSPGSPTITNRTTDLYIDGNGFFAVQDANGDQFLTRAGNFTLDGLNQIVNPDGMLLLDSTGNPITLESDIISFTVAIDGKVIGLKSDGSTEASPGVGKTAVQITTVSVTNPSGLKKEGGSLYSLTTNADSNPDIKSLLPSNSQLIAGQLEMSNVDLSEEMTEMIIAQRGLQANSKIITTSDQVLEEIINLKR